jgi:hypothetical protein
MAIEQLQPTFTQSPYAWTEGKVLLANRVYVAGVATAAPTALTAGATPTGWTDLGSIDASQANLTKADPTIIDVSTGLFEVLQGQVATKDGDVTAEFTMVEYLPAAFEALTGDVTVGAGVFVGGRPLLQRAVLFVGQNAATGSEFHHYNPKSNLRFVQADVNRFQGIKVTCTFLKFKDAGDVTGLLRDYKLNYYPSAP